MAICRAICLDATRTISLKKKRHSKKLTGRFVQKNEPPPGQNKVRGKALRILSLN
jgi:hypothetical protein